MHRFLPVFICASILSFASATHIQAAAASRLADVRGVWQADFNHDGTRVVVRTRSGEIGLWDAQKGTPVAGDLGLKKPCIARVISADGRWLLVGFNDGKSRVFDMASGKAISPLLAAPLVERMNPQAVFSPTGELLVIFGEKETQVLEVRSGKGIATLPIPFVLEEEAETTAQAVFTKDGAKCFLMHPEGRVIAYETTTWKALGEPMKHPPAESAYQFGFAASADGKWVATFDSPGENGPKANLQLWNALTGKPLGEPLSEVNGFEAEFLPAKDRVLLTPARGEASVRELPSLAKVFAIAPHDDMEGPNVAVVPNGQWLLAWGADRMFDLLDATTGARLKNYSARAGIQQVLFAPDSASCYAVFDNSAFLLQDHYDYYVVKFRLPDLEIAGSARVLSFLQRAALAPDGRRLLVVQGVSDEERVLIFDTATMQPLPPKKP